MKRFFRQCLSISVLTVLAGGANAFLNPNVPPWDPQELGAGEVDLAMVDAWDREVLWVDARSEAEFAEDRIPGAVLLNQDRFDEQLVGLLDAWDGRAAIVVYCDSRQCGASGAVARRLREDMGLPDVYVLKAGWKSWQEERGE